MAVTFDALEMSETLEFDSMDSSSDLIDYMLQFDDDGGNHPYIDTSEPFADALPTIAEESTLKAPPVVQNGPKRRRPRTLKQPAVVPPTRRRPRVQRPKSPSIQRPNDSPRSEDGVGSMERSPYADVTPSQVWDKPSIGPTFFNLAPSHPENISGLANLPPSPPSTAATSPTPSITIAGAFAPSVAYNFINNQKSLSKSHTWTTVYDPASKVLLTRVPESTLSEIQNAVTVAQAAQKTWRQVPYAMRRSKLQQLAGIVRQNAIKISTCLCTETGSPLQDSYQEVMHGIDLIEAACSLGNDVLGTHAMSGSTQSYTIYEALGVCLTVTPFSSPFLTPLKSIPLAIITGNTAILKPSEQTPSAAMLLADCFDQADFPPGILSIIHGGPPTVTKLLSQSAIRAITFTGCDLSAERVHDHAIATRKRIQAFCGSKNHAVVLADANPEPALHAIARSAFAAAGQRCTALSVVVFVGASAAAWRARLVQIVNAMRVGYPAAAGVDIGPLVSAQAKARVEAAVQTAVDEGATILLDGRQHTAAAASAGNFLGPTVLANVQPYMQCYQTEIFGPVLSCLTVERLEDAVELINDNKYGNSCSLFTTNPAAARSFQYDVNIGRAFINATASDDSASTLPPVGTKESFLGDVTGQGKAGWQFFTQTKTITSLF